MLRYYSPPRWSEVPVGGGDELVGVHEVRDELAEFVDVRQHDVATTALLHWAAPSPVQHEKGPSIPT